MNKDSGEYYSDSNQNGEEKSLASDEKTKESYSWQAECKMFGSNLAKKFKPKKRKMGNLILISPKEVKQEPETLESRSIGDGSEKPTFATTVSGMLSKFFCSRNISKVGPEELQNTTEGKFPSDSNSFGDLFHRKRLSELFTTNRGNNTVQNEEDQNYTERIGTKFNRFSKLEEILEVKDKGMEDKSSDLGITSSESDSRIESATGAKNIEGNRTHIILGDKEGIETEDTNRIEKDVMNGKSPNSESEELENTVFSPYTHRPSLQDIPGIDNTQADPFPIWGYYIYGLLGKGKKSKTSKNMCKQISTVDTNKFNSLDEEINSHLSSQSRNSLIPRIFGRYRPTQVNKIQEDQTEPSDGEYSPKLQSPATSTPSINLSESFTTLRGILKYKYKSNFSRDKYKKENVSVRFVSPTLSPIEMTNKEEICAADCERHEHQNIGAA